MVEEEWKYKLILLNQQIEKGNFGGEGTAEKQPEAAMPIEQIVKSKSKRQKKKEKAKKSEQENAK